MAFPSDLVLVAPSLDHETFSLLYSFRHRTGRRGRGLYVGKIDCGGNRSVTVVQEYLRGPGGSPEAVLMHKAVNQAMAVASDARGLF